MQISQEKDITKVISEWSRLLCLSIVLTQCYSYHGNMPGSIHFSVCFQLGYTWKAKICGKKLNLIYRL